MHLYDRLKRVQPLFIVLFLTIFLHAWAVSLLPQDFDEPVYLQNGFDYANAIRSGKIETVIDYPGNPEHPPFVKILYSGVILALGKAASWINAFYASRAISALFGILAVLFVALAVDPLAAGLLAVNTLALKYTSQVYLEAVPHAMTLLAVLTFLRARKGNPGVWFWISSTAVGVSAASKYAYLPVILLVLAYLAVFEKKIKFHWLVAYGGLALAVFLLLDVSLWHNPIERLIHSFTFHIQYSQGEHVSESGYPWYQPFIWIFTSPAARWHPNVFFYFGFDGLIALLGLVGVWREWKNRRWLVIWLVAGILFLLVWPTKWPQYALTVIPPICIMAAETLRKCLQWARTQEAYWGYIKEMVPRPGKIFWVAVGGFIFFVAVIYLSAAIKAVTGRVGWSHIDHENSLLPNNTIHALLPLGVDQMMVATDSGVGIWTAPSTTDAAPAWTLFTMENSGLPSNNVLSLAHDTKGNLWFGTSEGISRLDGNDWVTFQDKDLHLTDDTILSITAAPNGNIYAGTLGGAAEWDGSGWNVIQPLEGQAVFTISISKDGQTAWFGTGWGAGSLDTINGTWTEFPSQAAIKHLTFDPEGILWAATSGNGLAHLQSGTWIYYLISNSDIENNLVNWVTISDPRRLWVGTALPTNAGGAAAWFDGTQWYSYLPNNSGASGAEVTVIAIQNDLVWMGTRTAGIDILDLGREK